MVSLDFKCVSKHLNWLSTWLNWMKVLMRKTFHLSSAVTSIQLYRIAVVFIYIPIYIYMLEVFCLWHLICIHEKFVFLWNAIHRTWNMDQFNIKPTSIRLNSMLNSSVLVWHICTYDYYKERPNDKSQRQQHTFFLLRLLPE